jgi:hypothetical protein
MEEGVQLKLAMVHTGCKKVIKWVTIRLKTRCSYLQEDHKIYHLVLKEVALMKDIWFDEMTVLMKCLFWWNDCFDEMFWWNVHFNKMLVLIKCPFYSNACFNEFFFFDEMSLFWWNVCFYGKLVFMKSQFCWNVNFDSTKCQVD